LKELISKDTLNIFTCYEQEENRFTNGLVSLLELSKEGRTPLIKSFLKPLLDLPLKGPIGKFRVLRGFDGTADAELSGRDCCIRLETKIQSGTLREDQVREHLKQLERSPQALKVLLLLTPDDGGSDYIKRFLSKNSITRFCRKDKRHKVLPLEWKHVYDFLDRVSKRHGAVFGQLVSQFLRQVHDRIFDQDFAGIILKIAFGDRSEVYSDKYLKEIEEWSYWNTPREYTKLNGTGRKLLLYDKDRKAITAEVEIENVRKMKGLGDYPWRNFFVPGTLRVDANLITLLQIEKLPGFKNFHSGGSAAWNLTQAKYSQLTRS
jgi:hypothetical protein